MKTAVPRPRQSVLTALAGLTAYRAGMHRDVLEIGAEPMAFAGAIALAEKLTEELRRAGGDPDEVLARVYAAASRA
jgi:hypothetical protein